MDQLPSPRVRSKDSEQVDVHDVAGELPVITEIEGALALAPWMKVQARSMPDTVTALVRVLKGQTMLGRGRAPLVCGKASDRGSIEDRSHGIDVDQEGRAIGAVAGHVTC